MEPVVWSRTRLVAVLKALEAKHGFAGSSHLLLESKRLGIDLRRRIRSVFGSLREAKVQAGLRTWPLWTAEALVSEIKRLADKGTLRSRRFRQTNRRLVAACERHFGSWSAALTRASIPLEERPPRTGPVKYGCEDVLRILRDAWKRRDVRVNTLRGR